jgi:hypothetical protein
VIGSVFDSVFTVVAPLLLRCHPCILDSASNAFAVDNSDVAQSRQTAP